MRSRLSELVGTDAPLIAAPRTDEESPDSGDDSRGSRIDTDGTSGAKGWRPMHSLRRLHWCLILAWVTLGALVGGAFALDDGGLGGVLCRAEGPGSSPGELSRARPGVDVEWSDAAPGARLRLGDPRLLASVPGGLCLLL
jgi:hypothetical protein